MRSLETSRPKQFNEYTTNVPYGNDHRTNALKFNDVRFDEAKIKGPVYRWVPKTKT